MKVKTQILTDIGFEFDFPEGPEADEREPIVSLNDVPLIALSTAAALTLLTQVIQADAQCRIATALERLVELQELKAEKENA